MLIATCCLAASTLAAQPMERNERTEAGQERAQSAPDEAADRFAERHGVSRDELTRLEREEGMSWGDISHALAISERSKRPLSEILEHRRSGDNWRGISKRYELDYSKVRQGARRMEREAREAGFHGRQREGRQERPERGEERHQRDRDMMRDQPRDRGDSGHR